MNRLAQLTFLFLISTVSQAQTQFLGINLGLGQSRADLNGVGRMLYITGGKTTARNIRIGLECGFGYFEGKGLAGGNDFKYSTHFGDVKLKLGYTFQLDKFSINLTPSVGAGSIAYNSKGEFTNPQQGNKMVAIFGPDHFVPKYTPTNQTRYCTEFNAYSWAVSPSLCIEKKLSTRLQLVLNTSYSFLYSDAFDGYAFQTWSNQSNDQFWSITTGIHWNLYRVLHD